VKSFTLSYIFIKDKTWRYIMDRRAIGIFDSGLGGISVLRDIVELMPNENYIYYGDSANAPYGTKPTEVIGQLSENCANFLLAKNVKAIVIACNTATSVSAARLRSKYPEIPIIGIEPALKPAVLWKEHDRVAVMATPATLALPKFQELLKLYQKQSEIYSIPCPGLADYVEAGKLQGPEITEFLRGLLSPYLERGIDAIVLGCTHYPFVQGVIQEIAGPSLRIFNGSHGTAMELCRRLRISDLLTDSVIPGEVKFYNSSSSPETEALCHQLFDAPFI
jgi:glutamate racemase